jgi:hypothetical protein
MGVLQGSRSLRVGAAVISTAIGLLFAAPGAASAAQQVVVSTDSYTNGTSYHATEVEADIATNGSAVVSVFQAGRFSDGGASNLGWATSADHGRTWQHGFLPSTTVYASPAGPWQRMTDPAVAYDAKHGRMLIVGLASNTVSGFTGRAVLVSASTDGVTWGAPVTVATSSGLGDLDSTWIGCDGFASSPTFGTCYAEFDDFGHGNQIHISRSSDGGATWTPSSVPAGASVLHGQPLVQPNGHVVVPIANGFVTKIESFVSTDGGQTFNGPFSISPIALHVPAGNVRSLDVPTADVDASGRIYVVWYDCRFRTGCSSNDLVLSTSTDGQTWTAPARIPLDATTSTVDHFLPGLGVRAGTSGASAQIALAYYFYPDANCSVSTCQLEYGMTASLDGGATWTPGRKVSGPFKLTWLPSTTQGFMVGDYSNAAWTGRFPESVYAVASKGTCQLGSVSSCHEPMAAIKWSRAGGATAPVTRASARRVTAAARSTEASMR